MVGSRPHFDHRDFSLSLFLLKAIGARPLRNRVLLLLSALLILATGESLAASCESLPNMAAKAGASRSFSQQAQYYREIVEKCTVKGAAAIKLADMHLAGRGVPQNTQSAIFYFIKAIESGIDREVPSQYRGEAEAALGWIFLNGAYPGAPQDLKKALEWNQKAARKGHPNGLSNLALIYGAALGVPRDERKALELLRQSIEAYSKTYAWRLERSDEWQRPMFRNAFSRQMLEGRKLFWEGLSGNPKQREKAVNALVRLSASVSGASAPGRRVAVQQDKTSESSVKVRELVSLEAILECVPAKSAARINEIFRWSDSRWKSGEAAAAIATELLFPSGRLSPPCSYETFVALLQRGVALGEPRAFELLAISYALGVGFEPKKDDVEYWLYRTQQEGLTPGDSLLTPFSKEISAQVRWDTEISGLVDQHLLGVRKLVNEFQSKVKRYSDQDDFEAAARKGNHAAGYNLAVRAYSARKYEDSMEYLRSIRGKYPTAYLESILLAVPAGRTRWDEVLKKRRRINEIFEDLPEEKKAGVLFIRAKLEMATQSIISGGSLSTLAIQNLAEAAGEGEMDAAYLLSFINSARDRKGIPQFGDKTKSISRGSNFYPTSIGYFERAMADLTEGERKGLAVPSVVRKVREYLPSDPERRDPIARWLVGQVMTEPPQGLARLLIELFEREWFSVLDGKEELVALKMLIGRNAPSEEISHEELLGWLTELEEFSAKGCSYCRSELALGLLKVGSSDPERLGRAFEWLGETVRRDGSSEYEPILSALGEALSQVLIKGLQVSLQKSGYYQGAIDGKFGNGTRWAAESLALDVGVPLSSPPSFEGESAFDWLESTSEMARDAALESDGNCASAIGDEKAAGVLCASFAN